MVASLLNKAYAHKHALLELGVPASFDAQIPSMKELNQQIGEISRKIIRTLIKESIPKQEFLWALDACIIQGKPYSPIA